MELPQLPELPESPSDASDFSVPTPTSESPQNVTATATANSTANATNTDPLSPRGNGRVYEFSQDGKLKLKISLKGLKEKEHEQQQQPGQDSQTSNTTIESQTTIASQSIAPPTTTTTHVLRRSLSNTDTLVDSSLSDKKSITPGVEDDVFSDDINMSELENETVSMKKLSERIRTLIVHNTFAITITFSESNRHKLHPSNLNSLKQPNKLLRISSPLDNSPSSLPNKRLAKVGKVPKPPKQVKRPKPLYSRLMVKKTDPDPDPDTEGSNKIQPPPNSNHNDDDELMEKYIRLSLKDPLSGSKIVTPIRSRHCSHAECFDYESFLSMYGLKPFRIMLKRYSPVQLYVGNVDVMKILEDTKREVVDIKLHNVKTAAFQYKNQMRLLKEKQKPLNELEWFCCPICKVEFNIKKLGDIYVVGEFIDLLQDLSLEPDHETVEDLEINTEEPGKWRWVKEEENNALIAKQNELAMQQQRERMLELSEQATNSNNTNSNSASGGKKEVEIVLLDSDVEQDGADDDEANNSFDEPLNFATEADEEAMMQEIDALFEEQGIIPSQSSSSATPTASSTNAAQSSHRKPLTVKEMMMMTGGGFVRDPQSNGHAGVVTFRPGVFTNGTTTNGPPTQAMINAAFNTPFNTALGSPFGVSRMPSAIPPAQTLPHPSIQDSTPVFMTGDGAADDPIVLD